MINGATINAASFDGKNDLAVEKYQAAYEKYRAHRTKLLCWKATYDSFKDQAKQDITKTDHVLELYNKFHKDELHLWIEPQFLEFYNLNVQQKQDEGIDVGAGVLVLGLAVIFSCKLF